MGKRIPCCHSCGSDSIPDLECPYDLGMAIKFLKKQASRTTDYWFRRMWTAFVVKKKLHIHYIDRYRYRHIEIHIYIYGSNLCIHISIIQFIYPSIHPCIYLTYVCMYVWISIYLSIHLSMLLSIHPPINLSIHPSIHLSNQCMYVCIYLSIYL